jgi:hypothetical protein
MRVAEEVGLHEACVLAVLLKYRAYDGPQGKCWVSIDFYIWEEELPFLNEDEIKTAIWHLYESNDVLIPAQDAAMLSKAKLSDCYKIEYLISPQSISILNDMSGWVYLYQMQSICKIGMTGDLKTRYRKLCTSLPYDPLVWAYCKVSDRYLAERAFHLMWSDKSVNGRGADDEWYDLNPTDMAFFLHCARYRTATPVAAYEHIKKLREPLSVELAEWQWRFEYAARKARPQQYPRPTFNGLIDMDHTA